MYKIADWIDKDKLQYHTIIASNPHVFVNEIILLNIDETLTTINKNDIDSQFIHVHIRLYGMLNRNNDKIFMYIINNYDLNHAQWQKISMNANNNAIDFLEKNPEKIVWHLLSSNYNPRIIQLYNTIKKKIEDEYHLRLKISMNNLNNIINKKSTNKFKNKKINSIVIHKKNIECEKKNKMYIDKKYNIGNIIIPYIYRYKNINNNIELNWKYLSKNNNDEVVDYLLNNYDCIEWNNFSLNTNNKAVDILRNNIHKINWQNLSKNSNDKAIELLNEHNIHWSELSSNINNKAIDLLIKYPHKIDWNNLSKNSCDKAVDLLEKNTHKIIWSCLSMNKNPRVLSLLKKIKKKLIIMNFQKIQLYLHIIINICIIICGKKME